MALDSGQERIGDGFENIVPCLIFELAEGDVRKQAKKIEGKLKLAWWLKALHHTAVGLNQLHSRKITHQDLKPSNILCFGETGGFKLGDLGRSICEDHPGPFDDIPFPGDRTYAPLEILYHFINRDAFERRRCCDAYMLGSMIFFFGLGMGTTPLILRKLPPENWPFISGGWEGPYSGVLPLLQNAYTGVLEDLKLGLGSGRIADELIVCARQLCEPDPAHRGHPIARSQRGSDYSLERYVSTFDRLAKRAAIEARLESR